MALWPETSPAAIAIASSSASRRCPARPRPKRAVVLPWWIAWRNIRSHKARAFLNALGIALGIGLIFAVLSLSTTLLSSFDALYSSVYGKVDLVVTGAGGQGTLKPSVVNKVSHTAGVKVATPKIQSTLSLLKKGKA